ncbi:MAG: FkbM family methyltransferase [Clostridia bacterium]|nr:FkbM family methyltransferase [Clostridia bacterium]
MDDFLTALENRAGVWERIRNTKKPVVLYGTGDGADKLLRVLETNGITPSAFFASDEFVRGKRFHGEPVLSFSETIERYPDPMILIVFGSNRPEVLKRFSDLSKNYETLAPDLPVAGDTLFDREFLTANRNHFLEADSLFSDEESHRIFRSVLRYKFTGEVRELFEAVSDPDSVRSELICPDRIHIAADLGAYTGDTIRELMNDAPSLKQVFAMEPDAKSFAKLSAFAQGQNRIQILCFPFAAWSGGGTLPFFQDGSRGSAVETGERKHKGTEPVSVQACPPDELLAGSVPDWIKYDVEGAEAEAVRGTAETIRSNHPRLQVAMYHRTEDLFALPLLIRSLFPFYRLFLRRFASVPAWELQLYAVPEESLKSDHRIK